MLIGCWSSSAWPRPPHRRWPGSWRPEPRWSASDGRFAYDLAVTILAWCFGDELDLDHARALVAGYESRRPLEAAERAGLQAELALAALRFATTRITDYAMPRAADAPRVIKDWRRFWKRLRAVEALAGAL